MHKTSYLKIVLAITFVLITVSIGYAGWKNLNGSNKVKNQNSTSMDIQKTHLEPITTSNQKISEVDISGWKTYEGYRFGLKYPSNYVLKNRDLAHPLPESRSLIFNEGNGITGTSLTVEVMPFQELKKDSFHRTANMEYISYIKNSNNYKKSEFVNIKGKDVQIVSFAEQNPGELGDFRNTIVAILEHGDIVFVIKKTPAFELDVEFKAILATLHFY